MAAKETPSTSDSLRRAEYHQTLNSVSNAPLRSILAIGAFTGATAASIPYALPLARVVDLALMGKAPDAYRGRLAWTPGFLIANNLVLAMQIPVTMIIERLLYKQPIGSICSVENRFRWGRLSALAKRALPAIVLFNGLAQFAKPAGWPQATHRTLYLGTAVLLTTPLQSAAEEFAVRGLLQRVVGSWITESSISFWTSTALTSAFFASIHMSRDIWTNAYYAISGVCASLMTRWTGGLEASVLVHAIDNVALMLPIMIADNMTLLEELTKGNGVDGVMLSLGIANILAVTWLTRHMASHSDTRSE